MSTDQPTEEIPPQLPLEWWEIVLPTSLPVGTPDEDKMQICEHFANILACLDNIAHQLNLSRYPLVAENPLTVPELFEMLVEKRNEFAYDVLMAAVKKANSPS